MKKKAVKPNGVRPAEERSADAVTVAWMLTTLATLGGMLAAAGVWLAVRRLVEPPPSLAMLPGLLLVTAAVSGAVVLALTPVVLRVRKTRPPAAVTWAALFIGAAPWLTLAELTLMHQ